jgi:hypothetical protein
MLYQSVPPTVVVMSLNYYQGAPITIIVLAALYLALVYGILTWIDRSLSFRHLGGSDLPGRFPHQFRRKIHETLAKFHPKASHDLKEAG